MYRLFTRHPNSRREGNLNNYTGHIVRGKYQREHFMTDVNNLRPGKAVMAADYMMKLLF